MNSIVIYLDPDILDPETLYNDLKLKQNKIFNIERLRDDEEFIKTSVADLGYAFADVDYDLRKNTEDKTVDVVFHVVPNQKVYINDVFISGNTRTLDRVIRRDVFLAPKDLYSHTDYTDSINALKRTGHFTDVKVEQIRVSEDKMDLLVKVVEAPTGMLVVGGGYGSYDGFLLNASINDSNIFGTGKDLQFATEWSKKKFDLDLSLFNPAIFDSKFSGLAKIYSTNRENDNYSIKDNAKEYHGEFTKKSTGLLLGVGHKLTRNLNIGTNIKFDKTEETYSEYTGIDPVGEDYTTVSLIPYLRYNSTDDYFLPRNGLEAYSSIEYAGLTGDSKFLKSQNTLKFFYGMQDWLDYDVIFRNKLTINYLKDLGRTYPGDSFSMGGIDSVRGYEDYAFTSQSRYDNNTGKITHDVYNMLVTNNAELTFPLFPKAQMRWGVFIDYGIIKGEGKLKQQKRAGTGAFVEWNSPVGPLQFVFAHPLMKEDGDKTSSFEFSLGQRF